MHRHKSKIAKSNKNSKPTGTNNGLAYFKDVIETFNNLYQVYLETKPTERASLITDIQFINNMHINNRYQQEIPAICYYVSQKNINANHIEFLDAIKNVGLIVNFSSAVDELLLVRALTTHNTLLLNWLLINCNIKIPHSNVHKDQENWEFDNTITAVLEEIEKNIDSPHSKYLIATIPKYHEEGNSVLHLAALHNKPNLFYTLVQNGTNINQLNKNGETPVMLAVENKSDAVIELILENPMHNNIDVTITTSNDETIFHKAILGAEPNIFQFALEKLQQHGISFSELTIKNGFNILHWAIDKKQGAILSNLFPLVDLNAPGPDGHNLIVYAFIKNEPDKGYYIAAECKIDIETSRFENNKSIAQFVIENDACASLIWLIEEGFFDISTLSNEGLPPLLLAAKYGSCEALDEIVGSYNIEDLQVFAQTNDGKQYGHYIVDQNIFYLSRHLLEYQALDLNHKDSDGNTVLDIALIHGESHRDIINLFLDYIEKDAASKKRKLSLRLSKIKQLPALLNFYCTDTVGIRASKIDDNTPLHLACLTYDIDYIHNLVTTHHLDINQTNDKGETALSLLIQNAATEKIISIVTRLQAKITELDKNDSTLLQLACEHNLESLVAWCLNTKHLSITKPRKDKFSALDLTIIRRNSAILHLLWEKLTPKQKEVYILVLQQKNECILLEYLQKEGLFTPLEKPAKSIAHMVKIEKAISDDDTTELQSTNNEPLCEHSEQIEPKGVIICDEETLFNSIEKCDFIYFKELKHYPEHQEILERHAKSLLIAAIHTKNYRLVYHILRIQAIAKYAHLDDNAALKMASQMGLKSIVEALLRINAIVLSLKDNATAAIQAAKDNGHKDITELLENYLENQDNDETSVSTLTMDEYLSSSGFCSRPSTVSPEFSNLNEEANSESFAYSPNFFDTQYSNNNPVITHILSGEDDFDIFKSTANELNIHAKNFEKLPDCFINGHFLKEDLIELSNIFKESDLDGYIYGSTHFSLTPGDLDIFIPANIMEFNAKINRLINLLINTGGTVTSINSITNAYGYYYEGRYIIPIDWHGIKLELVSSYQTILQHARNLDFTVGAKYLSIATLTYAQTPNVFANTDISLKRIQTTKEAHQSFLEDPRRIFRAIKIMIEGYSLSDECYHAIQDIFHGADNPFIGNTTPQKIYYRMEKILQTGRAHEYFEMFNRLGIFTKLYECFLIKSDYTAIYYRNILTPLYQMYTKQNAQQTNSYNMKNSNLIFNGLKNPEPRKANMEQNFVLG